jgi:hypothetical protein
MSRRKKMNNFSQGNDLFLIKVRGNITIKRVDEG